MQASGSLPASSVAPPAEDFINGFGELLPDVKAMFTIAQMQSSSMLDVLMTIAAHLSDGLSLVSIGWLIGCLLLLSVGELLVGALGFWLAGRLGSCWDHVPPELFFGLLVGLPLLGIALCGALWLSAERSSAAPTDSTGVISRRTTSQRVAARARSADPPRVQPSASRPPSYPPIT